MVSKRFSPISLCFSSAIFRAIVAPENPALGFYERAGFVRVGTETGALGDLMVMEWTL